jgi:hypothetical protein
VGIVRRPVGLKSGSVGFASTSVPPHFAVSDAVSDDEARLHDGRQPAVSLVSTKQRKAGRRSPEKTHLVRN